jgi:predicted AAA+ superfamily ATPase
MKRKIEEKLKDWKETRNQALLVKGARQIGKTYIIEHFIKKEFKSYKEVNFANNPLALEAFSTLKDYSDFKLKLALIFGDIDDSRDSVIFFDEIQLVYRHREELKINKPESLYATVDPITLIKEVVQKEKRRYIFSGSLLGINMEGILLNPIGYMDVFKMYPLDFTEFLWAKGISSTVIDNLKKCFINREKVDNSIHTKMLSLFHEYILVGGMPEAVNNYINNNNFPRVSNIQEQIIGFYHRDIVTYTNISERLAIQEVFDAIPSELSSKNKRFKKNKLDLKNAKNLDLSDRFLWLTKAGVALPTYNVTDVTYPLKLNEQRKTLKLFLNDVGMLSSILLTDDTKKKLLNNEINVNYGAPFENVVAQELMCHGYSPLYYFNSKKMGEIDFVLENNENILPLEIKSGKSKENSTYDHKALDNVLIKHPNIKEALVFSEENTFSENKVITNLPIYLIEFLINDKPNPFDD